MARLYGRHTVKGVEVIFFDNSNHQQLGEFKEGFDLLICWSCWSGDFKILIVSGCTDFVLGGTVDGSEIRRENQLIYLIWYYINIEIYRQILHPRWLAGILPSTVLVKVIAKNHVPSAPSVIQSRPCSPIPKCQPPVMYPWRIHGTNGIFTMHLP